MNARRLLLFVSIVLLAAALSSAMTASTRDDDEPDTPPVAQASPGDRVTGKLPSDQPVTAKVGDVVELSIGAEEAERAEIRKLGVDVAVGDGLPGKLIVLADRPGRYPVTLRYSGREVGMLTVTGK